MVRRIFGKDAHIRTSVGDPIILISGKPYRVSPECLDYFAAGYKRKELG